MIRPSTAVELAGFGCLSASSFVWQSVGLQIVTGLLVTGALLLFIGYATEDTAAALALSRVVGPLRARAARRKAARAADVKPVKLKKVS